MNPRLSSVTRESSIVNYISDLELTHQKRLSRYKKFWKYYEAEVLAPMTQNDVKPVKINLVRKFVDQHVNALFREPFSMKVPDNPLTEENETRDRDFVIDMLTEVWNANNMQATLVEIAQMAGVTGDCFVRVSWEDDPDWGAPHPRIDVIPSRFVYPKYGRAGRTDRKRLESITVAYPQYNDQPEPTNLRRDRRDRAKAEGLSVYVERWTRKNKYIWTEDSAEPKEKPNPMGQIPIVHIPNFPRAGSSFGQSDIEDVCDVQTEYNIKATDVSDIIDYHAAPTTVMEGVKAGKLEKGANRTWSIPKDSAVYNLEMKGDLNASLEFLDKLYQAMHEVASVPEGALGGYLGVQSAAAMSVRYEPLIARRATKAPFYKEGIKSINRLIIRLKEVMDNDFYDKFSEFEDDPSRYETEISFGSAIPRNESMELDQSGKRLTYGLSSRRTELRKKGFSDTEIDTIFEQFREERVADAETEFKAGQKFDVIREEVEPDEQQNRSGNPTPKQPDPESSGENRSQTIEENARSGE